MKWFESNREVRCLGVIVLAWVAGIFGAQVPMSAFAKQPRISCEALIGWKLPATAIGLPTRGAIIEIASPSLAGDANGKYCRVNGSIQSIDPKAQVIRFQINLPSDWNEKAIHAGGGGYDGTLVEALSVSFAGAGDERPVATGYATFGSDSGHQSGGFTDPAPAKFGLNDEELENFGGAQLKKTRDVALEVFRHYYGGSPKRLYFYGNSQGGHEGLIVAQRWPKDYDGVVAIHPAYNFTALQLSGLHLGKALYKSPGAWLAPGKVQLVAGAVLRSCDSLDGAADGIIGNVGACRRTFKLDALRCEGGKDAGDGCLSDEQLTTVRTFDARIELGLELQGGVSSFAGWPLLTGAFAGAPSPFGLGMAPTPSAPPAPMRDSFLFFMADQLVRYMVQRDPTYDSRSFEPTKHADALKRISNLIDASNSNLDAFRARGGKLILLHGTVDMAISPQNTVDYYERLLKRYGKDRLSEFTRFYMVPGFGHGDGPFQMRWDGLTALDRWVDAGVMPVSQVASDSSPGTVGRTRPLCEYPTWPRYRGNGDTNAAASFRCTNE